MDRYDDDEAFKTDDIYAKTNNTTFHNWFTKDWIKAMIRIDSALVYIILITIMCTRPSTF